MQLPVEVVLVEFVAAVEEVARGLPERRRYLAEQMRRAAASAYLNLEEGIGEFAPGEKARIYRIAFRSLVETLGCLSLALRFHPHLQEAIAHAAALGRTARPMLHRLIVYHRSREH